MSDHNDRLKDYIEVPDRIRDFKEKFPDGSLQGEHQTVEVGGKLFVEYVAKAYRTPTDHRPGIGTTWEPFPGTTPYTKNSEVENAETSAWGRALAALGFVGKRIATAEEVAARQAEQDADGSRRQSNGAPKPSPKQLKLLHDLITRKKPTVMQLRIMLKDAGAPSDMEIAEGWAEKLTGGKEGQVSALIDRLMNGTLPEVKSLETPASDVPDEDAPAHEPAGDDSDVPFSEAA